MATTAKNNNNNNRNSNDDDNENTQTTNISEVDERVRQLCRHNHLWLLIVNCYASFAVFFYHLITLESILSLVLSVSLTITLYYTTPDGDDNERSFNGLALNWVLLSFAVITPIASSVTMAFGRRETAVRSICTIRATLIQLYVAHSIWDWGTIKCGGGREALIADIFSPFDHANRVYDTMMELQMNLCRFLTLPGSSRARHRTTPYGQAEARQIDALAAVYHEQVTKQVVELGACCEVLKRVGFPGNEAARIRSWEHILMVEVEQLRNLKRYRTPQGLRCFGRLFSIFLPPFYAPYYTDLARQLHSLAMGIGFAILTALALTALFETVDALEDPFVFLDDRKPQPQRQQQQGQQEQEQQCPEQPQQFNCLLDGINVHEELVTSFEVSLSGRRRQLFPVEMK
jgi:hypothetical protein